MSLWFDREGQEQKLLGYMPKGKAYKQAWVKGTNFNKLMVWIAMSFKWLVDRYNRTFKGLYVCESDYLVENWKKDYSIPNKVFYLSDKENRTDVFVLKYLMKGNTEWHFRAIANIYGVDVLIDNGRDYFAESRLPNRIPHKLYSGIGNVTNVLVVVFLTGDFDKLPHKLPHKLGSGRKLEKIKRIYGIIKEAQCKILYMPPRYTTVNESVLDRVPSKLPHILGTQQVSTKVYDDIGEVERIEFCEGVDL